MKAKAGKGKSILCVAVFLVIVLLNGTLYGQVRSQQLREYSDTSQVSDQTIDNPSTVGEVNRGDKVPAKGSADKVDQSLREEQRERRTSKESSGRWDNDIGVFSSINHDKHPALAYDTNTNTRVFAVAERWDGNSTPKDIVIKRSTDHGETWPISTENFYTLESTTTNPLKFPKINQISNNQIGMIYVREFNPTDWDIYFRRFSTADVSTITGTYVDVTVGKLTRPSICSDYLAFPDNPWTHVTYINSTASPRDLIYRKSTNLGTDWQAAQNIATISTSVSEEHLHTSIDTFGSYIVIAYVDRVGSYDAVKVIYSSNLGSSWTGPRIISSPSYHLRNPQVRMVNDTNIIVTYEYWYSPNDIDVYYSFSTDAGLTFSTMQSLAVTTANERFPNVSSFKSGTSGSNVFITYTREPDQLYVRRATNLEYTTWSTPVNIKNSTNDISSSDIPAIIVKPGPDAVLSSAVLWAEHWSPTDIDIRFDAYWRGNIDQTISGYVTHNGTGLGGVTINFTTQGSVTTNASGYYSKVVPYGWSGQAAPSLEGYTFTPSGRNYTHVFYEQLNHNYAASQITQYMGGQITHNGAGLSGVTVTFPGLGAVTTDDWGFYYMTGIPYGWSGTVTPSLPGYSFTPPSRTYNNLTSDLPNENYTAAVVSYVISGNVFYSGAPLSGVTITPSSGNSVITDTNGYYSISVPYAWSGTVTPSLNGYVFSPPNRTYEFVIESQYNQDYTASLTNYFISGQVTHWGAGLFGVTLTFSGLGSVVTDTMGSYMLTYVPHGWSGTVTPSLAGYSFDPPNRTYTNVTSNQAAQNYTASVVNYTISGQITHNGTGLSGVAISFQELDIVTTDASGNYALTTVPHGWSGTATPSLAGYTFSPPNSTYSNVTSNQTAQNYTASPVTQSISGQVTYNSTGLSGVTITFSDLGEVSTNASGEYAKTGIPYGWSGTATPSLTDYTFYPEYLSFTNVTSDLTEQNFDATSVDVNSEVVAPLTTELFVPYPNPFNPATSISFSLHEPGYVRLEVLNIAGQKVRNISQSYYQEGKYILIWDGKDDQDHPMPSGMYVIRMVTDNRQFHQKVLMIK